MHRLTGFIIAGTHSGVGKTTLALGIMAALKRRGHHVVPFKVGPDYIDPGHHTTVTGCISRNLDGWMLTKAYNRSCFFDHSSDGDLAVVEGVMGLFDGFSGSDPGGSTAQMAGWLGLPVVLVVDAGGMAGSAAALVQGFERFDPTLTYAGVVFNNIGGPGHLDFLMQALEGRVDMPCLGGLQRWDDLTLPERHLGLVMAGEWSFSRRTIERLAGCVESGLDLDLLISRIPRLTHTPTDSDSGGMQKKASVRIAVARDDAFCFYYQDNLDMLVKAGAQLVPFSPLADKAPPEDIGGIYLGGGYPELYANRLSTNRSMRRAILSHSRNGMPIYGECGGLMYLCRELVDTSGDAFPMSGCFPFSSRMRERLAALGYREIFLNNETPIGNRGIRIRGHEYHYSDLDSTTVCDGVQQQYTLMDRNGVKGSKEGFQYRQTLGSYIHLHFGSCPDSARHFVGRCLDYSMGMAEGG